jgi:hypothetical protein
MLRRDNVASGMALLLRSSRISGFRITVVPDLRRRSAFAGWMYDRFPRWIIRDNVDGL